MSASGSGDERVDYLGELCRVLWPAPSRVSLRSRRSTRSGHGDQELIVLPGLRRPRLLVPARRVGGAVAIRQYGEPGSLTTMLATRVLATALGIGMGPLLGDRLSVTVPHGTATIESYLTSLVGEQVEIGVHLTSARANRKPVLQVLTTEGTTVGFAKIGVNSLTAELIHAERDALRIIGGSAANRFLAPEVMAEGTWLGHPLLLLTPLPVWRKRTGDAPGELSAALVELSQVLGVHEANLTDDPYWKLLLSRLEQAGEGADQRALRKALDRLAAKSGHTMLRFGAWHGDFTPWNATHTDAGLLVWDWERFADGVPVGFDALHYWIQSRVASARTGLADLAEESVRQSPNLLAPFDVTPGQAVLTALVYLADVSIRYLIDRQADYSRDLGTPGRWLIPALRSRIEDL